MQEIDAGSILGSGRSPEEGNGNPLQYSCLENAMDRGAWWATVRGVAQSQTRLERLSMHAGTASWLQIGVELGSPCWWPSVD